MTIETWLSIGGLAVMAVVFAILHWLTQVDWGLLTVLWLLTAVITACINCLYEYLQRELNDIKQLINIKNKQECRDRNTQNENLRFDLNNLTQLMIQIQNQLSHIEDRNKRDE
jgi:hypothetical protein